MFVEQLQYGQCDPVQDFDAFVKVAIDDTNEMGEGKTTKDPPTPVDEESFHLLAGTETR